MSAMTAVLALQALETSTEFASRDCEEGGSNGSGLSVLLCGEGGGLT